MFTMTWKGLVNRIINYFCNEYRASQCSEEMEYYVRLF